VIASLSDRILALPPDVALLMVFLFPALEASAFLGFVFPGEIAVILGGVLASQGKFPLWAAIVAAVSGAAVGDSVGYWVGRRWGNQLLHGTIGRLPIIRRGIDKHLASASEYVRKRGPHAVLVGRFTAALRVLVPGLAGIADLPYGTFLFFNLLGAILWGTAFVVLGYVAGAAWHRVAADASRAGLVLLALVLLGLIGARVVRTVREHGTALSDRLAAIAPVRWFRTRYPMISAWLARRVDMTSPTGFALSVAVVGAALAFWLFGGLMQDVVANDDAALRDPGITSWVVAHRVAWITDLMRAVTWLGSLVVLIPLVVIAGTVLVLTRRTLRPMIQLAASLGASMVFTAVVRTLVDRPRPPVEDWLVHASGASFPSGHSTHAAAAFGMLAVVLFSGRRTRTRISITLAAVLVSAAVAASRVYLGVHWFTDILAGLALGWALVAGVSAITLLVPPRGGRVPPAGAPCPESDRSVGVASG
jgi:membrane protein DedA with SNARE-associated domain/membrane-associated phospholipid phosphatase